MSKTQPSRNPSTLTQPLRESSVSLSLPLLQKTSITSLLVCVHTLHLATNTILSLQCTWSHTQSSLPLCTTLPLGPTPCSPLCCVLVLAPTPCPVVCEFCPPCCTPCLLSVCSTPAPGTPPPTLPFSRQYEFFLLPLGPLPHPTLLPSVCVPPPPPGA